MTFLRDGRRHHPCQVPALPMKVDGVIQATSITHRAGHHQGRLWAQWGFGAGPSILLWRKIEPVLQPSRRHLFPSTGERPSTSRVRRTPKTGRPDPYREAVRVTTCAGHAKKEHRLPLRRPRKRPLGIGVNPGRCSFTFVSCRATDCIQITGGVPLGKIRIFSGNDAMPGDDANETEAPRHQAEQEPPKQLGLRTSMSTARTYMPHPRNEAGLTYGKLLASAAPPSAPLSIRSTWGSPSPPVDESEPFPAESMPRAISGQDAGNKKGLRCCTIPSSLSADSLPAIVRNDGAPRSWVSYTIISARRQLG